MVKLEEARILPVSCHNTVASLSWLLNLPIKKNVTQYVVKRCNDSLLIFKIKSGQSTPAFAHLGFFKDITSELIIVIILLKSAF